MQAKDLNSFFELNVVGSMNENEVDNQINVTLGYQTDISILQHF